MLGQILFRDAGNELGTGTEVRGAQSLFPPELLPQYLIGLAQPSRNRTRKAQAIDASERASIPKQSSFNHRKRNGRENYSRPFFTR
jgi:hypothetical protein